MFSPSSANPIVTCHFHRELRICTIVRMLVNITQHKSETCISESVDSCPAEHSAQADLG